MTAFDGGGPHIRWSMTNGVSKSGTLWRYFSELSLFPFVLLSLWIPGSLVPKFCCHRAAPFSSLFSYSTLFDYISLPLFFSLSLSASLYLTKHISFDTLYFLYIFPALHPSYPPVGFHRGWCIVLCPSCLSSESRLICSCLRAVSARETCWMSGYDGE